MIEKRGDFWNELGDAHVITTNGVVANGRCVMGRGVALQAKNRFPGLDKLLGSLISERGNRVHALGLWTRADGATHNLFSFPVKKHWRDKADIELIKTSIAELILECPPALQKIVMVRPGCGNGGLRWDGVKEAIKPFLGNRFIIMENFRK